MKIPTAFKLFATTYRIVWDDNRLNDRKEYGLSEYSVCEIVLSTKIGVKELSKDRIMDTYYHERTHAILDMMGENELSENEKFVDVLSKLLRQADESAEFKEIK